MSCYGGTPATDSLPGAIVRGRYFGFFGGSNAGIFSIYALNEPRFEVVGTGRGAFGT